ncbi:hypothetical protein [Streptomyces axinellae]|uniref:Helix-turn-helix domain-containing protein n=1 Tax=Streptomyces axinellae TaxID=552788 RepID=A0ABP6D1C5_9ACTN
MTRKATKPPTSIHGGEGELKRYTPEEVVELRLLPYTSVRTVKEKAYRRELFHHTDGGRITFTAEDLRRNGDLGAVEPLAISRAA